MEDLQMSTDPSDNEVDSEKLSRNGQMMSNSIKQCHSKMDNYNSNNAKSFLFDALVSNSFSNQNVKQGEFDMI